MCATNVPFLLVSSCLLGAVFLSENLADRFLNLYIVSEEMGAATEMQKSEFSLAQLFI